MDVLPRLSQTPLGISPIQASRLTSYTRPLEFFIPSNVVIDQDVDCARYRSEPSRPPLFMHAFLIQGVKWGTNGPSVLDKPRDLGLPGIYYSTCASTFGFHPPLVICIYHSMWAPLANLTPYNRSTTLRKLVTIQTCGSASCGGLLWPVVLKGRNRLEAHQTFTHA